MTDTPTPLSADEIDREKQETAAYNTWYRDRYGSIGGGYYMGLKAWQARAVLVRDSEIVSQDMCSHCHGSGIEEVYGGHGNVKEMPCSYCQPTKQHLIEQDLIALAEDILETTQADLKAGESISSAARKHVADFLSAPSSLRQGENTRDGLRRQLAEANALISQAKELINEQAEDDGLWFVAETITETQLQRALRKLSAIIEETDEFGIPLKEPKL